jgi:hypothetical protein
MQEGVGAIQRGAQQHISSSVRSSDSGFFSGISHGVLFGLGTKPVTTGIADLQRQPRRFYPPFSTEQGRCIFGLTFFCRWISSILYDIPQVSFEYQSKHLHNSQFVHYPHVCATSTPLSLANQTQRTQPQRLPRLTILRALGGPPRLRVSAKLSNANAGILPPLTAHCN